MSDSDQGGAGRREVAYRVFAAEYDDADFSYSESDEERAPNYVILPSGGRVNRVFVVGVLTEVEQVNEDTLRARVADPTGAFVTYAGQYQPDEMAFLERADPPTFVALTGKARTFQPEDSDRVYTSVRPESINEVDAETRDRWVVNAAEQTLRRVGVMARAMAREERGEALRDALVAEGVDEGLAAGSALAIDHYGTTPTYLDALRDLALDAARVVAGEREEADPLTVAPDESGSATTADLAAAVDATADRQVEAATADSGTDAATSSASAEPDTTVGGAGESGPSAADSGTADETSTAAGSSAAAEPSDDGGATDDEPAGATSGDGDEVVGDDEDLGDFEPGEFELEEDERERIEEEYGTEFETGTEVDDPGEADIETPDTEAETAGEAEPEAESTTESEPEPATGSETDTASEPTGEEQTTTDEGEAESDASEPEPAEDVDLSEVVLETMTDLDEGDGAARADIVEAVVASHGVTEEEVTDAIEDALMSGECYEPDDGRFKPI
jgi:RPA family protein